ncbi:MAG: hypothetical protein JXA33_26840 [Anaerolineae bacterium]|nr:hypothetical protein [Anaerolineae bacterium]
MQCKHPDYYTHLLERRLNNDPTLTVNERRELDLHLLICRHCNEHYKHLRHAEPLLPLQTLYAKFEIALQ